MRAICPLKRWLWQRSLLSSCLGVKSNSEVSVIPLRYSQRIDKSITSTFFPICRNGANIPLPSPESLWMQSISAWEAFRYHDDKGHLASKYLEGVGGTQLQLPLYIKNSLVQKDKQRKSDKFIIWSIIILHSRKLESFFKDDVSTCLACFPASVVIRLLCPVV